MIPVPYGMSFPDHDKSDKGDSIMEHKAVWYLVTKRSTGNKVERFTDQAKLFARVDQVSAWFEYAVTDNYFRAIKA